MRAKSQKRKGVFLISVLFVTIMIVMYLGAAVSLAPGGLFRSRAEGSRAAARQAAISGVDYATARLRKNPLWKGDFDGTGASGTVVNTPDMYVYEDKGNVVGLLKTSDGDFAQFRLRFNFQDGAGGPDNLNDPTSSFDLKSVSVNNLSGATDTFAPQVTGAGSSVVTGAAPYHLVPGRSVWLSVEGRAGAGTRGLSSTAPNAPVSNGTISRVVVETALKLNDSSLPSTLDAVSMAASGFDTTLASGNLSIGSSVAGTLGRIRSNDDVAVSGGQLTSPNGEAHYRSTFSGTTSGVTSIADTVSSPFYQIAWANVTKAGAANPLRAGTYVIWQDGSVHYFDMNLEAYKNFASDPVNATSPGQAPNWPTAMNITGTAGNWNITVTDSVNVTAGTNTSDLAIIPRSGAAEQPGTGGGTPVTDATYAAYLAAQISTTGYVTQVGTTFIINDRALDTITHGAIGGGNGLAVSAAVGTIGITANKAVGNGAGTIVITGASSFAAASSALTSYLASKGKLSAAVSLASGTTSAVVPGTIPNNAGDSLLPSQVSMRFAPSKGFAVLSGPANVTLGTGLGGQGGSVVSNGDLKIIGMGVDLAANQNAKQGVSLYSRNDMTINTFQATSTSATSVSGTYRDAALKGVLYSGGDLTAVLGTQGRFTLTGAMVAYGGDPATGATGTNGGAVNITAANVSLMFDPSYLQNLMNTFPPNVGMIRTYWNEI